MAWPRPGAGEADWAHVLAAHAQDPRAIRHALDNLPSDWPPNAMQFRDLCRLVPPRPLNGLEAPKPDPAWAAAARKRIRAFEAAVRNSSSSLQWAIDLRRREHDGERLSTYQRNAYRYALGLNPGSEK